MCVYVCVCVFDCVVALTNQMLLLKKKSCSKNLSFCFVIKTVNGMITNVVATGGDKKTIQNIHQKLTTTHVFSLFHVFYCYIYLFLVQNFRNSAIACACAGACRRASLSRWSRCSMKSSSKLSQMVICVNNDLFLFLFLVFSKNKFDDK